MVEALSQSVAPSSHDFGVEEPTTVNTHWVSRMFGLVSLIEKSTPPPTPGLGDREGLGLDRMLALRAEPLFDDTVKPKFPEPVPEPSGS